MTVLIAVSGFVVVLAVSVMAVLLVWSRPGQPRPFVDDSGDVLAGSISEKTRVDINGLQQGMIIKGRDTAKPVLLFLHGGISEYFLTQRFPTGLDAEFVVCWWEQRGAGLSYRPGMSPESATVDQLVADTLVLTDYLRRRFGKDRIYLMGHSGGSFLGMHAVAMAPERFHAYIGVGQMANQLRSEACAYDSMLERCKKERRTTLARRLEAAPVTLEHGVHPKYYRVRDKAMHTLGVGTMRTMRSIVTGLLLASLRNRDYTVREKINLWRGKATMGVSSMWKEMLATDLAEKVPRVDVPVYLLHGVYDSTCVYAEASSYFGRLKAPLKGFYTFEESAHSPIFEEPEKVMTILRDDVLNRTIGLADRKSSPGDSRASGDWLPHRLPAQYYPEAGMRLPLMRGVADPERVSL